MPGGLIDDDPAESARRQIPGRPERGGASPLYVDRRRAHRVLVESVQQQVPRVPLLLLGRQHPPAIAGTMVRRSPSFSAVLRPCACRTSSSLRNRFTYRRRAPLSSSSLSLMPGYLRDNCSRAACTVAAFSTATSPWLAVRGRSGAGIFTVTGMVSAPSLVGCRASTGDARGIALQGEWTVGSAPRVPAVQHARLGDAAQDRDGGAGH